MHWPVIVKRIWYWCGWKPFVVPYIVNSNSAHTGLEIKNIVQTAESAQNSLALTSCIINHALARYSQKDMIWYWCGWKPFVPYIVNSNSAHTGLEIKNIVQTAESAQNTTKRCFLGAIRPVTRLTQWEWTISRLQKLFGSQYVDANYSFLRWRGQCAVCSEVVYMDCSRRLKIQLQLHTISIQWLDPSCRLTSLQTPPFSCKVTKRKTGYRSGEQEARGIRIIFITCSYQPALSQCHTRMHCHGNCPLQCDMPAAMPAAEYRRWVSPSIIFN